ncbi:Predicted Zn-dependent peptidase [Andreprevotia lacus DSM 23236]|jgi:predicted Zn-dependent peptidase|uniref:Predicted Zn-dependent peptidase n=1 Tax=Andreprevotia lacus DSM 23236 TaxID=1121001 RepID=A0A1W1X9H9_9NEIS|nr:insulinase family protein [Andreprevotia lacus]SMC20318.1 Predicted Zn-dependent peptidase [Andreprevotia lacus DSM 23236]
MLQKYWVAALLLCAGLAQADEVRKGQLDNGLNYVIEHNASTAGRAELRLVVKAGSRDELDDEQGIAHLLEHMAFRRSKHFGPGEIGKFFDGQGMRWGNDSNAWTGWETTSYRMTIGNDAVPRGLQLMADWAGGIEFDPAELKLERQVVLDEMRLRSDDMRFYRDAADVFYPERDYSSRMPIGEEKVLKTLPLERIAAFYRRNYVAPRMTVIVVGDVDASKTEQLLHQQFATTPAGPVPAPWVTAKPMQGTGLYTNYLLRSLPKSRVIWGWVEYWDGVTTDDGRRRDHQYFAIMSILQHRLQLRSSDNFTNPQWSWETMIPHAQYSELYADPKPGKTLAALEELYTELERARRNGFSDSEADFARKAVLQRYEQAASQPLLQADRANWLATVASDGGLADTPTEALVRLKQYLPDLTPEKLQKTLDETLRQRPQLAAALRSPNDKADGFGTVTDSDIAAIQTKVAKLVLDDGQQQFKQIQLLDALPQPGKVVSSTPLKDGGIWTLSNGMQVQWRKQLVPNEQIGIAIHGTGGLHALPASLQLAGLAYESYISSVGMGKLSLQQLRDALNGKSVQLNLMLGVDQYFAQGSSSPQDIETLLQLIHLGLQGLPEDEQARNTALASVRTALEGKRNDWPDLQAYGPAWPWAYRHDAELNALQAADIVKVHRALYGNPAALKVVITGVADAQAIRQLVARYLASSSADAQRPALLPLQQLALADRHTGVFNSDAEGNSFWRFISPQPPTLAERWQNSALADILRQRLQPLLRFNSGQSYGVWSNADGGDSRGILIRLGYTGPTDQCATMARTVLATTRTLSEEGPSDAELKAAHELLAKWRADWPHNPAAYAASLGRVWQYGPPEGLPDLDAILTRPALQQLAQRLFTLDHSYLAVGGCQPFWGEDGLKSLVANP